MIDEGAFKQADEDGLCLIESNTNKDKKYLIVKVSKDNKRVSMMGDHILIINLGDGR